jgi:TM2 domain-containing membrane protein YozV
MTILGKIGLGILTAAFAFLGMLVVMLVLGYMLEGVGQYNDEHDRCLTHATNGYEMRQCR